MPQTSGFAAAFPHGRLDRTPRRGLAVVTCMDARIDPLEILGLRIGDANVLRNAGAVVTEDVLRSLAVAHALLGVSAAAVIGHTECGLHRTGNKDVAARLGPAAGEIDFLTFDDVEESVRTSVRTLEASRLLPDGFAATGFVYDVRSGRLQAV